MRLGTVLAVLAVVGMVGIALAQDANTATSRPARPLMAQVVKVQDANVVVKPLVGRRGGDANEVTVLTTDKTVVTVDGKDAKVADLKADMYVVVTPATGKAEKIVATKDRPTPPAGGGRRGGAAPAAPAN